METIIVVDDEKDIGELMVDILSEKGYQTLYFSDTVEALEKIRTSKVHLAIVDIWMDGSAYDGIKLLEIIKNENFDVPVIMISGNANIHSAVKALKIGAVDFIDKPFNQKIILEAVERALKMNCIKRERHSSSIADSSNVLVGTSQYMNNLRMISSKIACTSSRVLVTGPSGSGKETIARFIHHLSGRKGEFVALRAPFLFDIDHAYRTIFGFESHHGVEVGVIEKANDGTLFIDEVSDLSKEVQQKILCFLQEKKFNRVNGNVVLNPDIRLISASSKDLNHEVNAQKICKELYYRLSVIPIKTIPLSEHSEDIRSITKFIIEKFANSIHKSQKELTETALTVLQSYSWPGNIRQLKNIIELIMLTSNTDIITELDLPIEILTNTQFTMDSKIISMPLKNAREEFEKQYIKTQLIRFGKNITKTAEFIKMERSAFYRKLKSLGLDKLIF